jgi:3alpha(or 20beta)-hydroxysteroid dehydrogenase
VVLKTLEAFGGIDILINNAGVYMPKTFQETDESLLDLHYRANVLGPFLGMQAVYPVIFKAGGGAIVNVASGAATCGYPGLAAYAASKWMLRGLSRCAAADSTTWGASSPLLSPAHVCFAPNGLGDPRVQGT